VIERHAVACALFTEALQRRGLQQLVAGGLSMLPAVWPGDRLTIRSASIADLGTGDIAAWRTGDRIVVHRVVRAIDLPSGRRLVTRGDAMPCEDEPVSADALLGRVVEVSRGGRTVPMSGATPVVWRLSAGPLRWWFALRQQMAIRCATP
jgi:signal peptidase